MKEDLLGLKYSVSLGKMAKAVSPFCSGFGHGIATPAPWEARFKPRCFSYHWYSRSGSFALKKIPPTPMIGCMLFLEEAAQRQKLSSSAAQVKPRLRVAGRRHLPFPRSRSVLD